MTRGIRKARGTITCLACRAPIANGAYAFGDDARPRERYHLECAATALPLVFEPFRARAVRVGANVAPPPPPPPRNRELEARVAANPTDTATLAVFADYLQSVGDPWGELIAYELAGEAASAKQVFQAHSDAFQAGHPSTWFSWHGAFIDMVIMALRMKPSRALRVVREILELPTMLLARELRVPLVVDAPIIAAVNALAPPRLTTFFCWLGDAVAELAVPTIERLHMLMPENLVLDVAKFAPILELRSLPKLVRLDLYDEPIPVDFLAALLDSPLGHQLEWLELTQDGLDEAGARLLLARADRVRKIRVLALDPPPELTTEINVVFADQLAAHPATIA